MAELTTRHKIIKSFIGVKRVAKYCQATKYCSFDFETKAEGPYGPAYGSDEDKKLPTGPQYEQDDATTIAITFQPGCSYVIPLYHYQSPFSKKEVEKILRYLSYNVFENRDIVKVGYNLKFEYRWFLRYNMFLKGVCLDMMLAKYLLDEERPNDLKSLVAKLIPEYAGYEEEIESLVKKYKGWGKVPLKELASYNAIDSDVTLKLVPILEKRLIKYNFYKLYRNMCMMQTRVLAESEHMGMKVDKEYLTKLIKDTGLDIEQKLKKLRNFTAVKSYQRWFIKQKIKTLIKECQKEITDIHTGKLYYANPQRAIKNREEKISRYITGELITKKERVEDFNPNSPKQLINLLYLSPAGFDFPIAKYTKDKKTKRPTETPSTDEEALLKLKKKDKSGFIEALLKYRETQKLYSTYMVAMEYRLTNRSTIHGSFLIHGTVTGRLSSKNPNLQNIPRSITSSLIKRMFIPPPGHLWVEVDYGQAELRIAAEMAVDKAMIEIFKKNYNIHVATGCKLNHAFEKYNEVKGILADPKHKENVFWEKQKKKGKVLNFSILFGQSDEESANQMDCSVEEAADFKQRWFEEFPEIKVMMKRQEKFCKKHGYVKNLFGRYRRLPDIYSDVKGKYNKAVRDAINAPIQGAASDFTQFSSIILREKILTGELVLTDDLNYLPQVYTVHDSLGFYCMPKYLHKAMSTILKVCADPDTERYFGFKMQHVNMKASGEVGTSWGSIVDYNAWENYNKWLDKEPWLKQTA